MARKLTLAAAAAALALTTAAGAAIPSAAQAPEASPAFAATQSAAGVTVSWREEAAPSRSGARNLVRIGDALVPGRTVALVVAPGAADGAVERALAEAARAIEGEAWAGAVAPAPIPAARDADGAELPEFTRPVAPALPPGPLTIAQDGRLRGMRIIVVVVTPLFERDGESRYAAQFEATIRGTRLLDPRTDLAAAYSADAPVAPLAADAPSCSDPSLQPVNPVAGTSAWRIRVARGGMQQLSAAALAAAGVPPGLANLRLRYRDQNNQSQEVRIRRLGDAIRFYAPPPGDRWNAGDTFWLTVGGSTQDMDVVAPPGAGAGLPSTAIERTIVTDNRAYESRLGGADRDYWYAASLRPDTNPAWTFAPSFALPYAGGPVAVSVSGVTRTSGSHTAQFGSGGASAGTTWSGLGTFTATFGLANFGASGQAASFAINKPVPDRPELILPDRAIIERPVALNFGGGGASFIIRGGASDYQTANAPDPGSNDRLYDVTDALNPTVVLLNGSNQFTHAGGDRAYVMTGAGTLWVSGAADGPTITPNSPFPLNAKLNLQAIYLAPGGYIDALQPLINLRLGQGTAAGAIAVEAVYDWWGHGQVSPGAIRNFLRYAYACWDVKPTAVTLVGDGALDARNYLGYGHPNVIPPYMAPVDTFQASFPEVAETSCDACYAQLDGADPLSDKLADLYFGRLPVKSAAELTRVVSKILAYEAAPLAAGGPGWRQRIAYVADNYRLPPSEGGGVDASGDFAAFSDANAALHPATIEIVRNYFGVTEQDSGIAKARTIGMFGMGAGFINYAGHGNERQIAVTRPEDTPNHLMYVSDVDALTNVGRLPVVLQMTCLTGAFQTPVRLDDTASSVYLPTTIDERLVLATDAAGNGTGAIATWSSSGLGVAWGHKSLQNGFYKSLWSYPRATAPLGAAAAGGYLELFTLAAGTGEPTDGLRTYVLLGDPLTRARVGAGPFGSNLPIVSQ